MTEYDLGKVVGDDGEAGNGIASITKTGTSGLVDTYTITFTSGATTTFQVTNGKDGSDASVTIVSSWSATTSDAKVPSEKLAKTSLDGKVDKVTGKGLSTNDFTNSYKSTIDGLSTVATSGSYSDLSNKPSIPSSSSDLSDGSNLVKKSSTTGLLKNDGTVMTSGTGSSNWAVGNHTHSGYISTSSTTGLIKNDGSIMTSGTGSSNYAAGNHTHSGYLSATKVTSWSSTPSDSNVASEKLIKDSLDGKANSTHEHYGDEVFSSIDLSNLGIFTDDSQDTVNLAINNAIGNKISKSQTVGLVKNDGSIDTNTYLTSSAISGMLTTSDVANNLTTTTTGKVLDARQGKALADLIGDAITYINQ